MKCPRCGSEMTVDNHRKYPIEMCYNCGYMEGLNFGENLQGVSNFQHLKGLNFNELVAFMVEGIGVDEDKLSDWLTDIYKEN